MNILLVSQCSKKALTETRRIIDQFAERRGDRTWQTPITNIGLMTLRKLLKKTARRNTAVACHWIRGKNHTELLWIVGNASKFNQQGAVPTNITRRDILRADDENGWATQEDIALLTGIAALFHDFGKANDMFQSKLRSKKVMCEPYRHEWVSLRMFAAFVDGRSDQQWLTALSEVSEKDDMRLIAKLIKDHPDKKHKNPFSLKSPQKLPPTARAVAWLILTHHKLPQYPAFGQNAPNLNYAEKFLDSQLNPSWNSPQITDKNQYDDDKKRAERWSEKDLTQVWSLSKFTPLSSKTWRAKAQRLALRALRRSSFIDKPWLDDPFTLHLARLSLMMADHYYSSLPAKSAYQDKSYKAYANSEKFADKPKALLKQKLDEHLIGVYRNGLQIVRLLPTLKSGLTQISRLPVLTKRSKIKKYQWQDKAMDVAKSVSEASKTKGFFGINMASTGQGKTFANCKIMYGLAGSNGGCRFSIALGLRTLTLQTGQAIQQRLQLSEEDIAVLIGSQSVKQLHDLAQRQGIKENAMQGSASANDWLDADQQVIFEGSLNGPMQAWFEGKDKANKLINAPILVSTIDHLMPATEADRGGKQIAPMLRLLTSDLVLDEIDDFDLQDLPAICRLVNWAGLMGSRVLLSSATLPPSLVIQLFAAYQAGRQQYNNAQSKQGHDNCEVVCAWFDEFGSSAEQVANAEQLEQLHQQFVSKRIAQLTTQPALRCGQIVPICLDDASQAALYQSNEKENTARAISALANKFSQSIEQLHHAHHQSNDKGQSISFGLIRMANINPLVAVAKQLIAKPLKDDFDLHICVYHSRHPLIVRSEIERMLDSCLNRSDPDAIWQQPSIAKALKQSNAKHHAFIVIASPVSEVGRDHDYDWAIVEPSSMRSIIQLAGRIMRHRNEEPPKLPNIHILSHNYKALKGIPEGVFSKPGFENATGKLASTNLNELLQPEQFEIINAQSRVQLPAYPCNSNQNLAMFEHTQLNDKLTQGKLAANIWWHKPLTTNYELQRRTRFRQSAPTGDYVFWLEDSDEELIIKHWFKNGELKDCSHLFEIDSRGVELANGVKVWGEFNFMKLVEQYGEDLGLGPKEVCIKYGGIALQDKDLWFYDEVLGVYQAL